MINTPTVYLKEHIHPSAVMYLKKHAKVVSDFSEIDKIEGIITRGELISRELMGRAHGLKVIGKHGVGYDNIDIKAARDLGKRVVYTPGCNTESVAELAVTHMLNVCRKVPLAFSQLREGTLDDIAPAHLEGMEIEGKTIGMIGAGRIGFRIAQILEKGFGAKVVIYDPFLSKDTAEKMGYLKVDDLDELCKTSNIINISVPLTDATYRLIDDKKLSLMNEDCVLVNTSRGGIVDENALYNALSTRKIRGAGMDVFENEPVGKDNKLLSLDNFVATPHIGACTEEAMLRVGMTVVQEVLDVLAGKEPQFPVV